MKSRVLPIDPKQEIQAYFSHSYRADDRLVNLFFWELFSEEGFFFTVDPKSDKVVVPHLERMMRYSDCFIAVVTRRLEKISRIGDTVLPGPQSIWTHSPYIAFENFLAELAEKPRLVFVESGLDASLFGTSDYVHIFERDTLKKRQKECRDVVHSFADKVRAYQGYKGRILKPTGKAGILIDTNQKRGYQPQTISDIQSALSMCGYASEVLSPHFSNTQSFVRKLSDLELIVTEIRSPFITLDALAFIQAKSFPCIRIAKLRQNESKTQLKLPELLNNYNVGDVEPVIAWAEKDELIFEIYLCLSKFQQTRTLLDTFEKGRKYFVSAGRKTAKIFISNPHSLNSLALDLVKGFQTVNIQYFQYQSCLMIGKVWQEELDRELQEFSVFVALVNDDYYESEWCQYELNKAFERWKKKEVEILPYILEPTRLPELIKNHIQCAFVHNLAQEELVQQIVNTIDEYLLINEQKPKGEAAESLRKEIYGKGEGWAVLAGANQYEDEIHYSPLQVCVKDTLALKGQLIASGYDDGRIKILTDQGDELPTRENILVALKSIASATEPDDLLLFYYSGHGVEKNGESYLVARNGRHLIIEETAIPISKVKEIMRSASARAKVIIIDACHSGVRLDKGSAAVMTDEFIHRVFEEAKGFAILASCEQGQVSYEWCQNERSVFTHYFLEALQGAADFDAKGFITIQDVNRYVSNSVRLWASQKNLSQTPTLHYEVAGDIILARLE
jgi:hypothetical protein